jgi:hypothetical protein
LNGTEGLPVKDLAMKNGHSIAQTPLATPSQPIFITCMEYPCGSGLGLMMRQACAKFLAGVKFREILFTRPYQIRFDPANSLSRKSFLEILKVADYLGLQFELPLVS